MQEIGPCDYNRLGETPAGYECQTCGAKGVRLFRVYQAFMSQQSLWCFDCAAASGGAEPKAQLQDFEISVMGTYVLAVPCHDGGPFWAISSIPDEGVRWWRSLPVRVTDHMTRIRNLVVAVSERAARAARIDNPARLEQELDAIAANVDAIASELRNLKST